MDAELLVEWASRSGEHTSVLLYCDGDLASFSCDSVQVVYNAPFLIVFDEACGYHIQR